MKITERDRKRLAALQALIKPAHSLAARLDTLTDEQRDCYRKWEARLDEYWTRIKAQCPGDENPDAYLYARYLEHDTSPRLRRDVETALFGKMPTISNSISIEEIARLYMTYAETTR